jgi:hypothetical protein
MSTFKVVPFTVEHFNQMTLKPDMKAETDLIPEYDNYLKNYVRQGYAYTLIREEDGAIVWASGVLLHYPGMGECWALTTPLIHKYPKTVARVVRKILFEIIINNKLFRVQVTCKAKDKRAVKFLKFLGFEIEGLMRSYGPDRSDHFMMGRVIS